MSGGQLLSGHVRRIDTVDNVELNAAIISHDRESPVDDAVVNTR